jgi:mannose-1-phosphate guanylyltransferase/mannose-6-phosphate isomerase
MKKSCIQPVVLSGGAGTRLWPLSRAGFPKQFLCLTESKSLFQLAVERLNGLKNETVDVSKPIIVNNEEHRFLVVEQLRELQVELGLAILEPIGRNTAPALTLAALAAQELDGNQDPILVVTPADQIISDTHSYTVAMHRAIKEAEEGAIVVLGIVPDRPEIGYGYIKTSESPNVIGKTLPMLVKNFKEKPDIDTAKRYLEEGGYYWNSGIFILKASVWLKALNNFRSDISIATCKSWENRTKDDFFIRPDEKDFIAIPGESIDFAVIEKCCGTEFSISMVPLNAGWSDLGAWDAVWASKSADVYGNVHHGDVVSIDCSNTLVHTSGRMIGLVGVENIVVVETPDALLVANKSRSQEVKKIVDQLQINGRTEHTAHRKVHRPWGWYDSVDEGHRFKVKRIQVNPGASLSLQKHHHRAEHWVVVKGTAQVTCNEDCLLLTENQSTYIPVGAVHRLHNPGSIPLEIIEIQTGGYLDENDIVRLDDEYGRKV